MRVLFAVIGVLLLASLPARAGSGYLDGSIYGVGAETSDNLEQYGGGVALHGGYAFNGHIALGGRIDLNWVEEDGSGLDIASRGFFGEVTVSSDRTAAAHLYLTGGVGVQNTDISALDQSGTTLAFSTEVGGKINVVTGTQGSFNIGPFLRYTFLDDIFDVSVNAVSVGIRFGWDGSNQQWQ